MGLLFLDYQYLYSNELNTNNIICVFNQVGNISVVGLSFPIYSCCTCIFYLIGHFSDINAVNVVNKFRLSGTQSSEW